MILDFCLQCEHSWSVERWEHIWKSFNFYLDSGLGRAVLCSRSKEVTSHSDKLFLIRASTGSPPTFTYLRAPSQLQPPSPFKPKAGWKQFKMDLQESVPGHLNNLRVFEKRGSKIPACVSVKRMIRHALIDALTPLFRFCCFFLSEGGQSPIYFSRLPGSLEVR